MEMQIAAPTPQPHNSALLNLYSHQMAHGLPCFGGTVVRSHFLRLTQEWSFGM